MRSTVFLSLLLLGCYARPRPEPRSKIEHLVVIVQENHTFDDHFGRYCTAAPGSAPTCTAGPGCCEAAPELEPSGAMPIALDDAANGAYDPSHLSACELAEINGGKMDRFVTGAACSDPRNFAVADGELMMPMWKLAGEGALADRWFQPVVGQSSSNDMFFARAAFVFADNGATPNSIGAICGLPGTSSDFTDKTIGDLLEDEGGTWAYYAEGYQAMADAAERNECPDPDPMCPSQLSLYPCIFDPSDNPFAYYPSTRDRAAVMRDYKRLGIDLSDGHLPQVSFVKGIGYRTEHPGFQNRVSEGLEFVSSVVETVRGSAYGSRTLILVTYDEGGGYFDHVAPPASPDEHPYGTRVPTIALGPFAQVGAVSHVQLEHSSIVRFIEWNWLGGEGLLGTRDKVVANLGSLLDPGKTGVAVP